MIPLDFKTANVRLAADQPEYKTLPVFLDPGKKGTASSCWKLTWRERFQILFRGRLWISMLTFHQPPMPILPWVWGGVGGSGLYREKGLGFKGSAVKESNK